MAASAATQAATPAAILRLLTPREALQSLIDQQNNPSQGVTISPIRTVRVGTF